MFERSCARTPERVPWRRPLFVGTSVTLHAAIIGVALALPPRAPREEPPEEVTFVELRTPEVPDRPAVRAEPARAEEPAPPAATPEARLEAELRGDLVQAAALARELESAPEEAPAPDAVPSILPDVSPVALALRPGTAGGDPQLSVASALLAAGAGNAADGVEVPLEVAALASPPEALNRKSVQRMMDRMYPMVAREAGIEGVVNVSFVIGMDGRVERPGILVLSRTHQMFVYPTIRGVMSLRFTPVTVNGRAVRVRVEMPVHWILQA